LSRSASPAGGRATPLIANHDGSDPMLDSLRRHATGTVAKILFGILIVSFAVWGIGDVFRGPRGGNTLAEVEGSPITAAEVKNEFDNRWHQLQQQYGTGLDRQTAVALGLMNQALETSIARRLVDAHAHDLRLTAADATIAEAIRQDPSFRGPAGFDRERFQLYLRSIGMSEQAYIAALRADMVRRWLIDSMTGSVAVPATLARKLVEHRQEERRGKALLVKAADIQVEPPSEETLKAYLEENATAYQAPEYRSATLLVLRPEDMVGEIEVSDADLRASYDSRIAFYRKPEQRRIEQLLAPDEATIQRAAELVAGGKSFADAAKELGSGVERSEVGPLAKGDLPASLDDAAWQLPADGVSAPVQSPFGWHLLKVSEIVPETTQPFDSVKEEIRRELALERAASLLPDMATRLDDEIAAGSALDEAARKLGLEAVKLEKFDQTGHTAEKERLAADRLTGDILSKIFAAGQGEISLLEQTQDGRYFMFRIDGIEPAHPRTLEEVRDEVARAWTAAEQKKRARARAEELKGQATSPAALEQLATGQTGVELVSVGPVTRSGKDVPPGLSEGVVQALFATQTGQVAAQPVDVPAGSAIVAVEELIPAKVEEPLVDGTQAAILNSMRAELIQAYEAALRRRYDVSVNQSALAQLMEAQAQ
jgi:peptidyl-prolyl cis-trans isomerase D